MNKWSEALVAAMVLVLILVCLADYAQGPPATETRPLTPVGKVAMKAIQQEIMQVNQDIQALLAEELEAQHLKASDGWYANPQTGQLERVVPPSPKPPEKPPESKPK